ncbi:MAG: hypothetical protein CFH10_00518 [Alphaproteobacteria bacterium MarineAlpha4_Bin2]|nr:MAG: hypothetical protein CFH10_00518 [Alphaproteobacteria bacterium MarineAlpha4_Bin2]
MAKDILNYEKMVERALRSVVVEALSQASEFGLPGAHHLYITFATDDADVEIPERLRENFPEEMTIVLQHQFWDLTVEKQRFLVTLSFNDIQERLIIPFGAVTAFADPSVNFGLQLKFDGDLEGLSPVTLEEEKDSDVVEVATSDDASGPTETENVVTLDAFRKK